MRSQCCHATVLRFAQRRALITVAHMKTDELIDAGEVARVLGISPRTLEGMRQEGRGPAYVRISSKCVRYRRSDLERFLTRVRVEPEGSK